MADDYDSLSARQNTRRTPRTAPQAEIPKPSIAQMVGDVIREEKVKMISQIQTITGAELAAKEFPPIKWAVPNLLPEGYGILGGRPKIGKSWLAYDIALAVAYGGPAIGNELYRSEPGISLYLALEDNERRLQKRQEILLSGPGGPELLHLATKWKRLTDGGLEDLDQWLSAFGDCRLVIVDTLARVKPRLKKGVDAYEHEMELGGLLQALATKHSVCLLAIHHTRKTKSETGDFVDELAGSTGITGAPDFVAQLSRGRRDESGILEITGKDIQEIELALQFEDGLWTILGNAQELRISENQAAVLETLRKNNGEPMTLSDMVSITGLKKPYVCEILAKLIDGGLAAKEKRHGGRYYIP